MREKCKKWHEQIQTLREKHAEFRNKYQEALEFAVHNHKTRDTAFQECRKLKDKIKPLVMEVREELGPVVQYKKIISRLTLSPDATENKDLKEKLIEMVSKESYREAVATAQELDPEVKVPTHEEIIKNLLALGPVKLEKIATVMSKPGLIIVPDKSMTEIIDAMNDQNYDNQNEVKFDPGHSWSGNPGKVSVSIVDMVQYPALVFDQRPDLQRDGWQLRTCEKYYRDNGMRLISDTQYAAAMQKSLRVYELAKKNGEHNPEKYILDFFGESKKTFTIFNQEHTSKVRSVATGHFLPISSYVRFTLISAASQTDILRGRGAVQVM